jgi:hypothetical protein
MFVLATESTTAQRSLLGDLRSNEAGCFPRIGASIVAGTGLSAAMMFVVGIMDAASDDTTLLVAVSATLVLFLVSLTCIWNGYHRCRRLLVTSFHILAIWVVAVPLCIWIDSNYSWSDRGLLIGSVILAGISGSLWLITTRLYRYWAGRPVITPKGDVNVQCPECGYSLIGLHEARCPECGTRYTLDELIRQQGYGRGVKDCAQSEA